MPTNFRLILIFLTFFVFASKAQNAKNQSLLWEITGNGLKSPSYLYGTMHVSNKIAFHLGDTFYRALDQADVIALESDPGEWMEEMYATKTSMLLNGYSDYMDFDSDKNFYEVITSVESPDKKTLISALRDKHSLQNGFLYRSSFYEDEFEESTYLDLFIYQYGKKNKKKVVNLELMDETNILQIQSMLPDPKLDKDKEKEKDKKKKSFDSNWDENRTVSEAMEDAYRDGNLQMIDSIMRITSQSDNYIKYFLYERNKKMVYRMDSLMKHNKLFIGIGAAHLPGEEGVIELLKKMGYSLRPVTRNITEFAKNKKNEIEETFLPVPFKNQSTKDGFITVNMPGKLYETPGAMGDIQYFYPEMINGGSFFISRFNTFSLLHQHSKDHWPKKIDSLLFENIEGKILSEKKIKVSGYDALDVTNKTRKGDYQRRLIVYTPLEIIFFKMTGTGEWVKIYGDEFFSSIKINKPELKSTNYQSHLKDYTVQFPASPIHNVHAEEIYDAPRYVIQAFNPQDSVYSALFSGYLNDFSYIEEDSFEVSFLIKTFYEKIDSAKIQFIKLEEAPFHKAEGKALLNGKEIYTQAFLYRNFYFLLASQGSEKKAQEFFNSFKYSGEFKTEKFETYTDSVLMYKVSTSVIPEKMEDLLKSVNYKRQNRNKNTWDSETKTRYFENPINKEEIYVNSYKYSEYFNKESLPEYWKAEFESYYSNGLIIKKEVYDNNDTLPTAFMLLEDTNSTKRIEVKKILKNHRLYTLKTCYDSLSPKSKFITQFFETFQPLEDSLNRRSVFESSANLFFADLRSMDSLRVQKAVELVEKITFKKEHVDSLIYIINNYQFPEKDKAETKIYLIRELGYIKDAKVIDHLVNIFENSEEDSKVQFAALKGLAKCGTKTSYKTMEKLLLENPPVGINNSDVSNFFKYFDDSLNLTQTLYPNLWELLYYNEYRDPLYNISVMMLDSSKIKPSSYKKMLPLLVREVKSSTQGKNGKKISLSFKENGTYYSGERKVLYTQNVIDQYYLTTYLKLLVPHYQKDKNVQKVFNKILVSDNNKDRIIATVILTKNKIPIHDSIFEVLSSNEKFSAFFYKALEKENLLNHFKTKQFSQEKFAKSLVYASSSSLNPKEDSITLVKKVEFKQGTHTGYVYFFKSPSSYSSKWNVHYAGLQPIDEAKINSTIEKEFMDDHITVYNEADINKEIDKIVKKLYVRNRERVNE